MRAYTNKAHKRFLPRSKAVEEKMKRKKEEIRMANNMDSKEANEQIDIPTTRETLKVASALIPVMNKAELIQLMTVFIAVTKRLLDAATGRNEQ